jgi:hypothetical protein
VIYSLVSGNVSFRENENELRVRIRVTNFGRGGLNFWDDSFRLVAGGQTMSPVSGLNAIVAGNSLQYGIISFRFPRQTRQATLQIISGRNMWHRFPSISRRRAGRPLTSRRDRRFDVAGDQESGVQEPAPLLHATA